jgi:hypothetical protein
MKNTIDVFSHAIRQSKRSARNAKIIDEVVPKIRTGC